MMYSFDFVCLGAGGGPSETDLSAYLLKSSDTRWEDGIIAVEAGSGIGALTSILSRSRDVFHETVTTEQSPELLAARIYSYIQTFLISHSHLDHVLSLVLSSGSLPRPPPLHASPIHRRRIVGTKQVLEDLSTMIFSDRIWPNLASWSSEKSIPEFMYLYDPIPVQDQRKTVTHTVSEVLANTPYHPVNAKVSVFAMPISHGLCRSNHAHATSGTYASTAFFIRHDLTKKQLLFFGDVEPDSLALNPSTAQVWKVAATLLSSPHPNGGRILDSIFIECSWPSTRKDSELYGHLNPQHLLQEMRVLASEVVRRADFHVSSSPSLASNDPNSLANNHSTTEPVKKKRRRTLFGRQPRHKGTDSNTNDIPAPASSIDLVESSRLVGALKGVKLYVMHFKAPMQAAPGIENGKLSQHIASELRVLVDKEELGLEVIAMEQGMRIQI